MINCLNKVPVPLRSSLKTCLNLLTKTSSYKSEVFAIKNFAFATCGQDFTLSNKDITNKTYECSDNNEEIGDRYNRFVSGLEECQTMLGLNQGSVGSSKVNSLLSARRQKVREARISLLQKEATQLVESCQKTEENLFNKGGIRSSFTLKKQANRDAYSYFYKTKKEKGSKDICKVFVSTLMQDGRKLRYQKILRNALSRP